jgi:hypothetical protein
MATGGAATHLGAHRHPVQHRAVHRAVRTTRDLVAQLQLAVRQHKLIIHRRG